MNKKYRRCFWVHIYLLSTYQIWLFHTLSSFICSAEAYFYSGMIFLYLLIILPNTSPYQASRIQRLIWSFQVFGDFPLLLQYSILWSYLNLPPPTPPLSKGSRWGRGIIFRDTFLNFHNKWGVQIFSIKNERLVK